MLKKRIIPIQLLMGDRLVKSKNFSSYREVGDPVKSSAVYNSQYADELILLNIDRDHRSIAPLLHVLEELTEECFMPLAVGGGITSFEDGAKLIKYGADKVVLNSVAYNKPDIISMLAAEFGAQAVVIAIDVKFLDGSYQLFSNCGDYLENITLEQHLENVLCFGAGEILIQSIDNDGIMQGFDIELVKLVRSLSSVPVIACGGSGNYAHLKDVFMETSVSAVACGSIFNFSDSNLLRAKSYLSNYGLPFKKV